jgi:integrase
MRKKPNKPSVDFPLTPHNNGRWCKKIKGKLHYFGRWEDPDSALAEYNEATGNKPPGLPDNSGHSIYEVLDRFLEARKSDLATGELSQRTWDDYRSNCDLILSKVDNDMVVEKMTYEDFASLRSKMFESIDNPVVKVGPTTATNRIRMAKVALRYIETIVPRFKLDFGGQLRGASAKSKRRSKAEQEDGGRKLHSALEIRNAVDKANPDIKAMLLLGINCAFGNSDCGRLTWKYLDLKNGWHIYHREKTFIPRRAKLWPETVTALSSLDRNDRHDRVFVTKYDNWWSTFAVSHEARKLGIEFYRLRRTFRTISDETREAMAIHLIMGHATSSTNMDHVYVQEVVDKRLELVSEYVRAWYLS